jgi:hypothetical protein
MSFDPLSAVLNIGGKVIDRLWPDPAQAAQAKLELTRLSQEGQLKELQADLELARGQQEINLAEAKHGGMFKGGWRPFVGWICGFALAYKFLIYPFLIFAVQTIAHFMPDVETIPISILPIIEWSELSVILLGMLGLGTMRTYEKRKTDEDLKK